MTSRAWVAVYLVAALGWTAGAQQPRVGPPARPAVSPYLNLLRPGNSPGVNYYGLVRPQNEFRNSLQGLGQQVSANRAMIDDLAEQPDASLPATGHRVTYLNTRGYYPLSAGGGSRRAARPGVR
jgi:hypothetical protein